MSFLDTSSNNQRGGAYSSGKMNGNASNGYNNGSSGNWGNAGNANVRATSPVPSSATLEDPRVENTKENIKMLSTNVTAITKMVQMIGTNKDSQEMRDKLNNTIEQTRGLTKDTTTALKDLSQNPRGSQEEKAQQRIVHQRLAKDAQVWVQKFQEITKVSAQRERQTPVPTTKSQPQSNAASRNSGNQRPSGQDPYDPEEEKQGLLESSRRQQLQLIENEREHNEAIIIDRDASIKQIEQTILDVNEIFTDLAQLVGEQGVMIDNIQSNIESSVQHTDAAVVELRAASSNQKKARSKLCWLALIITIVMGVVAVVLYITLKK